MSGNQRWRERKAIFRRPDEQIKASDYEVVSLDTEQGRQQARSFVIKHHHSASFPAARFRYGLIRNNFLVGVAVFSHPSNDRVLTNVFGGLARESVELGRFVLLDEVPGNGETFMLSRCLELLRTKGLRGVLSHSDPAPRRRRDGG